MKSRCYCLSVVLLSMFFVSRIDASTTGAAVRDKQNLAPALSTTDQARSEFTSGLISQVWTHLAVTSESLTGQQANSEILLADKSPPPKAEKAKKDNDKDSKGKSKPSKKVKKTKASPVKVKKPKKKK